MPTYDYKCPSCVDSFEKFHGINETPEIKCPECETVCIKQIGTGVSIHFKGSGFYTTDYKDKPNTSETKPVKKPESSKAHACGGACGCA